MSTAEIKAYLSKIGTKGGKKGRRKLTQSQARAMANKRWKNARAKHKKPR